MSSATGQENIAEAPGRQSRMGYLAALMAVLALAGGVVRLVISEMRMADAFEPNASHAYRESVAYWATVGSLSLAPAAVALAVLAIWVRGSRANQTAARVALAIGFWTALPLWIYELLLWMGYSL
ncbi:MAG: hypothetical protein ACOCZE_02010 [Planctomycetota bacterium]